jgi:pimeloyl-ACP methyl ester carboxylesterase
VDHGWCDNAEVRVHYLESSGRVSPTRAPVLVVPGWPEAADEYEWLGRRLADRRVVIADVRGRGPSAAPEQGYSWRHHISDLEAVVASAALSAPVLVAFSRGSSYALGYALSHPEQIRGLVIGDYPAQHVRLGPEFAEAHARMLVRGVPATERVPIHVAERLQVESEDVPLWHRLRELDVPVLLVRGGRPGALVGAEREARYRAALPSIRVACLEDAGHDLWSRDRDAYLAVLQPFLDDCDSAASDTG